MNRVIIIGAGNIGSRHLQSLAKSSLPLAITVVDPSSQSLEISKKRFDEASVGRRPKEVDYYRGLDNIEPEYDVGIVATNADVRRIVIERLLAQSKVKYLVIEKIAFQNTVDFESVIKLLKSRKTKAWVNLPRRVVPFYTNLKTTIRSGEPVYFTVQGSDWGLACNAIHFVDCLCYLIEENEYEIDCSGLGKSLKESKRKGFVEFLGALHCNFENGSELNLISSNGTGLPVLITIQAQSALYMIQEERGEGRVLKEENDWKWRRIRFKWPYQSDLTRKIVEAVISTGNCGLPSIEESFLIHTPLLNSFTEYIRRVTGKEYSSCPIT